MKKGLLLAIFLCVCAGSELFAQKQNNLDSLKLLLKENLHDTDRVEVLYELCFEFKRQNLDSAMYYGQEALSLSKKINYNTGIAISYNNLAGVMRDRGDFKTALEYFLLSSTYYEKGKNSKGLASVLNNIGGMYGILNNMPKALEYFRKSLRVKQEMGDKQGIANALNNIGNVYKSMGKVDSAMSCYETSLKLKKELNDLLGMAQTLNNIGSVYSGEKDYRTAIKYYEQSLDLKKKTGDKRGISVSLIDLATCYRFLGDYDLALVYAMQGLETSKQLGLLETMADAEDIMALIYADKKMYDKAYAHLNIFLRYRDSILNEKSMQQLNELQTKYETVEKDKKLLEQKMQIDHEQVENRRKSIISYGLGLGILLLGIVVFLVLRGYVQKKKANTEITEQKAIIEEKNKEILDSIHYAKRIQGALLASDTLLKKNLPEYFVFYKPKDIVSGDFYWASSQGDNFLVAVGDCTGHGVPGAFMSLLNINLLKESVAEKQILLPDLVLNNVRDGIITALNPEGSQITSQDGMDAVLCSFDFRKKRVRVACANNPLWIRRKAGDGNLLEFAPDKMPVGLSAGSVTPFTLHEIDLHEGDMLYMITDGYADQFGGPKGKKFKYKALQELLVRNSDLSANDQRMELERIFNEWKGSIEQVDDVLIMGIRV